MLFQVDERTKGDFSILASSLDRKSSLGWIAWQTEAQRCPQPGWLSRGLSWYRQAGKTCFLTVGPRVRDSGKVFQLQDYFEWMTIGKCEVPVLQPRAHVPSLPQALLRAWRACLNLSCGPRGRGKEGISPGRPFKEEKTFLEPTLQIREATSLGGGFKPRAFLTIVFW